MTPAPGWYPDPSGAPQQRWFDGSTWTAHSAPLAPAPKLNAFFVMLTVISAVPTLFCLLAVIATNGNSVMWGLGCIWSAAWTYVWWSLRHR